LETTVRCCLAGGCDASHSSRFLRFVMTPHIQPLKVEFDCHCGATVTSALHSRFDSMRCNQRWPHTSIRRYAGMEPIVALGIEKQS
jgi:hypothetical protein